MSDSIVANSIMRRYFSLPIRIYSIVRVDEYYSSAELY